VARRCKGGLHVLGVGLDPDEKDAIIALLEANL